MRSLRIRLYAVVAALLVFAGCEASNDSAFTPQIVIQGFLYANEPIDSIIVRRTLPITSTNESDRVTGAKVTLTVDGTSYVFEESTQSAIRCVSKKF